MTPTPITLADDEDLYRAGDLPDVEWEARLLDGTAWFAPSAFTSSVTVVARPKPWSPKPGDRVRRGGNRGTVLAVHGSGVAWVLMDGEDPPYTCSITTLSPEDPS